MILKCLSIVTLFCMCAVVSAQNNCCSGAQNILGGKGRCKDGSPITGLSCSHRYLLESGMTEGFNINSNGFLTQEGADPVPSNSYCLSKLSANSSKVALVCFARQKEHMEDSNVVFLLRASAAIISVVFLITTIVVYALIPTLRDLQGKCLLHSISALAIAMLLLGILQFGINLPNVPCHLFGYTIFVSFLATFTWLNIISFHIWRTTVLSSGIGTNNQWHFLYCIYGYGAPLVALIIAIIAHHAPGDHIKPGIGAGMCWFSDHSATWAYFYGPIAALLCLNLFFFIWTAKKLWKDSHGVKNNPKVISMKYKCFLYIKLFFIMGLSWIFEVISFAYPEQENFLRYIWLVTDFVNALQGVLIFLILVVFRKKALRGLAGRGLCCLHLPQQWKTLQDEECDEEEEERRLATANVTDKQFYKPKENQSISESN